MLNQEQWSLSCQLHDVQAIALECMFSSSFIEKLCVKHYEHQVLQDVRNKQTKKAPRWVQDPLMSVEGFAVHSITVLLSQTYRQDRTEWNQYLGALWVVWLLLQGGWLLFIFERPVHLLVTSACCSVPALHSEAGSPFASLVLISLSSLAN